MELIKQLVAKAKEYGESTVYLNKDLAMLLDKLNLKEIREYVNRNNCTINFSTPFSITINYKNYV